MSIIVDPLLTRSMSPLGELEKEAQIEGDIRGLSLSIGGRAHHAILLGEERYAKVWDSNSRDQERKFKSLEITQASCRITWQSEMEVGWQAGIPNPTSLPRLAKKMLEERFPEVWQKMQERWEKGEVHLYLNRQTTMQGFALDIPSHVLLSKIKHLLGENVVGLALRGLAEWYIVVGSWENAPPAYGSMMQLPTTQLVNVRQQWWTRPGRWIEDCPQFGMWVVNPTTLPPPIVAELHTQYPGVLEKMLEQFKAAERNQTPRRYRARDGLLLGFLE